jgi:murein DD-endopeptidase MepM/ murein hydrolase activator NlpD
MKSYFKPKQTVHIEKSAPLFQSRTFQKSSDKQKLQAASYKLQDDETLQATNYKLQDDSDKLIAVNDRPQADVTLQEAPVRRPLTVNWGKLIVSETVENQPQNARMQLFLLILTVGLKRWKEREFIILPLFLRFFKDKIAIFQGILVQQTWGHRLWASERKLYKVAVVTLVGILCVVSVLIKEKTDALPTEKYGFELSQFTMSENKIKQGDVVYSMLTKQGLTHRQADSLLSSIKTAYNFAKIKIGKPYALFQKKAATANNYLVIEPDAKRYFVFDLKAPSVKEVKRSVSLREFETGGKLRKTLYSSLVESGMSYSLIDMVQEALKNKFDISQCEDGDEYKLIWEEELIDGRSVGVNTLKSVYVKGQCIPKPVYAFYFSNGKQRGWYEPDSLPVRDGFLDSPVKNSVITSTFSLDRYHPILHYRRPHYGTDYAAPRGTPIISVADGVVEEAKYGGGNGKYVKIQHQRAYETQYLHMSRFASGIQAGTPVKQKQVIGYVGSTGLATGPHVCFRFSKLGAPINHLTERIFSPMDSVNFKNLATKMQAQLNNVALLTEQERLEQKEMLMKMRGKK